MVFVASEEAEDVDAVAAPAEAVAEGALDRGGGGEQRRGSSRGGEGDFGGGR